MNIIFDSNIELGDTYYMKHIGFTKQEHANLKNLFIDIFVVYVFISIVLLTPEFIKVLS